MEWKQWKRVPLRFALVHGVCVAAAAAQESVIFSLTSSATAPFGNLADTELAIRDVPAGMTRPWLSIATGAFYAGDVNGDGTSDEWKDVDAVWVKQGADRVEEIWLSFNTTFGGFLDGDIVRLTPAGGLVVNESEAHLMQIFGLTDGQMDLDGLHVGPDGKIYVSFADDEPTTGLSTDKPNVVTDGSIVYWDPVASTVGVALTEGNIDALVSHALGKSIKTGDTLGIAMDASGTLAFSVQSPSSDDASVFSAGNSGTILVAESTLGLSSGAEMDALDLTPAPIEFLAARATPRLVPANQVTVVDLDGMAANHAFLLTLSLTKGNSDYIQYDGFYGLALDPNDWLFSASIADLPWTYGVTDAAGHAAVTFDPAPPGFTLTVYAQAYDFDAHVVGTPIAIELQG